MSQINHLNSILIEGTMTENPVLRTLDEGPGKGKSVCQFTNATDYYKKTGTEYEKETYYFNAEAWGKLAEACASKGKKGSNIRVVGRLKQDRFSKIIIEAEHIEFRPNFKPEKKEVSSEGV
jgi:single-strand DNA-binding protein